MANEQIEQTFKEILGTKNNKKPSKKILIISIILIVLIGGGAWYFIANKPIEDQFKDWKTYTNEEYGFEVKYPEDWFFKKFNDKVIGLSDKEIVEKDIGSSTEAIEVSIAENDPSLSRELSLGDKFYKIIEDKNISVNGVSMRKVTVQDVYGLFEGDSEGTIILVYTKIPIQGKYFILRGSENPGNRVNDNQPKFNLEYFNQILSTFKFIEKDETANWKSYTNEKYGWEVKYPKEWFLSEGMDNYYEIYDKEKPYEELREKKYYISISKLDENFSGSVEDWLKKKYEYQQGPNGNPKQAEMYNPNKAIDYNLNGIQIKKIEIPEATAFKNVGLFLKMKKDIFWINYYDNVGGVDTRQNLIHQILSTFKFIDETANWKTYKNEEYGFEVKYPNFYDSKEDSPKKVWFFHQKSAELSLPGASIEVLEKNINSVIQELKNQDPGITQVIEEKNIMINNQSAKKLILTTAIGLNRIYYVLSKNNLTFLLSYREGIKDQLDILSTFKFIEKVIEQKIEDCGSVINTHIFVSPQLLTQQEKDSLKCVNDALVDCKLAKIDVTGNGGGSYEINGKEGQNCLIIQKMSQPVSSKTCKIPMNFIADSKIAAEKQNQSDMLFVLTIPFVFSFEKTTNTQTGEVINFECQ